jgi:hypothetical protein
VLSAFISGKVFDFPITAITRSSSSLRVLCSSVFQRFCLPDHGDSGAMTAIPAIPAFPQDNLFSL